MAKRRKQNVLRPNAELQIIRELWCPDKLEVVTEIRKTLARNVLHIKPSDLLTVFHSLNAGNYPKFDIKRLPREIQDMICKVMFKRDVIEIGAQFTSTIKDFTPFLRTCKWYYDTCRPILYSENIFRLQNRKVICGAFFENPWRTFTRYQLVYEFLSGIGPDNRALLRDIRLSLDHTNNNTAAGIHYLSEPNLLQALPLLATDGNLTHLTLAFKGYKCSADGFKTFMNILTEVKTGTLGIGNLERSDAENNWWLADPAVRLSKDRVPKDITRCQRLNDSYRNKLMRLMIHPASNPSGNCPRRGTRRTRSNSYHDYYSLQGAQICTRVPVYFGSATTSPLGMVVLKVHTENNNAILRVEPKSVFDLVKSMTTNTCIKNTECQRGFGDFPENVRKIIYQALFTGKGVIDIGIDDDENGLPNFGSQVSDFRRSAQFLRVCRLINLEGSDILYGENKFNFRRDCRLRTKSGSLQTVLYEDFWGFIRMISKRNVPRLRDISIKFQDIRNPRGKVDGWWYTRNEDLNNALYTLGAHGKLRQIRLDPQWSHRLQASDTDFLALLLSIKVDHVCFGALEESCAECCAETVRFVIAPTFQPQQYLAPDYFGIGGWIGNLYCPLAKNILKKMMRKNPEYPEFGSTDDSSKYHGELCPRCRGI